jgi:transcription-repair coupling factor (superfamily II helicase)
MFVQRADAFGLAQLYQLRGRIGRGKERAYCYLLVPPEGTVSGDARARLSALERFTELGAGFQIASHDLELRGAGNLLGGEQSGHIALVGFEAYTRIMEEAVAELRGQEVVREPEPDLNLDVPGFIPDEYVEDTGQRLAFYQKLSRAALTTESAEALGVEDAVERVLRELSDRYGQLPPEVQQLGVIMVIKGLAGRLGALSVDVAGDRLSLTLSQRTTLTPDRVIALINKKNSPYRLTQEMKLVRRIVAVEAHDKLQEVKKVLQELHPRVS